MGALLLQVAEGREAVTWPEAIIAVGGITMVTVVVAIAIWQAMASWRAKMSVAREEAYQTLAAESVVAQKQAGEGLERTASKLGELEQRTAALERLLKEVG